MSPKVVHDDVENYKSNQEAPSSRMGRVCPDVGHFGYCYKGCFIVMVVPFNER